jgi:hypothetical protein
VLYQGVDEYGRTYNRAFRAALNAKDGKDEWGARYTSAAAAEALQEFVRDGIFVYPEREDCRTPPEELDHYRAEHLEALVRAKEEEIKKLGIPRSRDWRRSRRCWMSFDAWRRKPGRARLTDFSTAIEQEKTNG